MTNLFLDSRLVPLVQMNVFRKRIYHTLDELRADLDTCLKEDSLLHVQVYRL